MNTKQVTRWHYEIADIPATFDEFDAATAAHARAELAIDWWKRELRYLNKWDSRYDEGCKALELWKTCQEKSAIVINSFQLKLF